MAPKHPEIPPPSIGHLKSHGVTSVRVECCEHGCGHRAEVSFETIGKPNSTPFPSLRFKCSKCSGAKVSTMPNWPPPKRV